MPSLVSVPHTATRKWHRRGLMLAVGISVLVHLGLAVMLLPKADMHQAGPPADGPTIELVQQDTVSGGGDRRIQTEGQARSSMDQTSPMSRTDAAGPVSPPFLEQQSRRLSTSLVAAALARSEPHSSFMQTSNTAPFIPFAQTVPMPPESGVPAPDQPPPLASGEAGTGKVLASKAIIPASPDSSLHNPMPSFPPEAMRRAEQGAVTLQIHVLPDGAADGVFVVGSSGHPALDAAAEMAVMRWRFHPARQAGQLVASDLRFRLSFVLNQRHRPIPESVSDASP